MVYKKIGVKKIGVKKIGVKKGRPPSSGRILPDHIKVFFFRFL